MNILRLSQDFLIYIKNGVAKFGEPFLAEGLTVSNTGGSPARCAFLRCFRETAQEKPVAPRVHMPADCINQKCNFSWEPTADENLNVHIFNPVGLSIRASSTHRYLEEKNFFLRVDCFHSPHNCFHSTQLAMLHVTR